MNKVWGTVILVPHMLLLKEHYVASMKSWSITPAVTSRCVTLDVSLCMGLSFPMYEMRIVMLIFAWWLF